MSSENPISACQRSGINIQAYLFMSIFVWAKWPTCSVNAARNVSPVGKCVFVLGLTHSAETKQESELRVTCGEWILKLFEQKRRLVITRLRSCKNLCVFWKCNAWYKDRNPSLKFLLYLKHIIHLCHVSFKNKSESVPWANDETQTSACNVSSLQAYFVICFTLLLSSCKSLCWLFPLRL